ncbi:uncharacterized protein N7479_008274 [Penicillium vulpinum]|uniref:uncharacterized protein n=1 Tax=Penicillium vulpinum TaxID=29845 RepID=UPI002548CF79|nr:uncharacterized protein N7479_008274 [Penicillium vulpinum]KAJ5961124.1 hypothetical protein N7479_008274 [Penicillium vulpinum]
MTFHPSTLESIPENEAIFLVSDKMMVSKPYTKPRSSFSVWKCSHPDCIANPCSKRAIFCRGVQRPLWALIFVISTLETPVPELTMSHFSGITNLLTVAWQSIVYLIRPDLALDFIPSQRPSRFSDWTTHGVNPIPCHSHNDYWRRVPLHSALRAGCISVEVDVWPWENEILVGHSRYTVLRGTLQSLYLDPLLKMLDTHNAPPRNWPKTMSQEMVGLFSNDPRQTLTLLIDFKTEGDRTWPILLEQLDSLREKGYLTHFNGSDVIYGPITVVASGDAPFNLMLENATYRDVFYDAPLSDLAFPTEVTADDKKPRYSTYNPSNSYYASADFRKAIGSLSLGRLSDAQLAVLRSQVHAAHKAGLKVRYWGTPTWPVGLRNYIWSVLVREGVDVINTDDLRGATKQDWKSHHWWNW